MNKFAIAGVVVACVAGGWFVMGRQTPSIDEKTDSNSSAISKKSEVQPADSGESTLVPETSPQAALEEPVVESVQNVDAERSAIVPGVWETNRDGRRVLTVKKDGTATMDVTVEGAFSFVVGSKMKFNIKWKIVDGKLDFEMIDGEPESSVNAVISLYGKKQSQQILEFSPEKFVLKDNDGEPNHVWTRVKVESEVQQKS